jgi:hypothetical protein
MTWAGDSAVRRLIAWVGQTAVLVAVVAIGIAIVWFVLAPSMIDGIVGVFANHGR